MAAEHEPRDIPASQRSRAVQAARIIAAATGGPDLNRAQRRALARSQRARGR